MLRWTNLMRLRCVSIWVLAVLSLGAFTAHAATTTFEIEPQDLSGALKAFAVQSHREIFFAPELARGRRSHGVKGAYDDLRALNIILDGTGLEFSVTASDAILVRDPTSKSESPSLATTPTSSANIDPTDPPIRMTQAGSTQNQRIEIANGPSTSAVASLNKPELTEIVVTAQKKTENLQDVPVPVSVLNADTLVAQNQLRLQDYYASVPGFTVLPADQNGAATLAIRGITTGGFANPTVGIVIDDVPYGSSTGLSGGSLAPDIDPSDLARVEVLRGPQGTLYGASSLGGLIKFVTVEPSTDATSGRIQADANTVQNGAELGVGVRGAVNVPITDTLAIRASAFGRLDPGYIDNPLLHIDGINKDVAYGGRLAALWRPTDTFSAKFSALYQNITADGNNDVFMSPGYGNLEQSYPRGVGAFDRRAQSYSLTLNAKFGSVDLTSLSGYSQNTLHDSYDYTPFLGTYTQTQFGVTATPLVEDNKTDKFTQEVRLSTPIGPYVDWLFGVFYTHERSPYVQNVFAQNPSGAFVGQWVSWNWGTTYAEYAAFTDVTFHVTDRFDIQVGGRESHNRQTYSEVDTGPYVPLFESNPLPLLWPQVVTNANSFTYLVTPSFKISPDFMLYSRLASGYRPGGPNPTATVFGLPASFAADTTKNYEIGAKGDVPGRAISFDASLYRIDWNNIQLSLTNSSGLSYYSNGSKARSQGAELSIEAKPVSGLTVGGWVAFNAAKLAEDLPMGAAFGVSGDRLPFSSRFSSNISAEDDFALAGQFRGYMGGSVSYVGEREGEFTSTSLRQKLPAYARTDGRMGIKNESWNIGMFANNITNKRGELSGGLGSAWPYAFHIIQPRTVGLTVSKMF